MRKVRQRVGWVFTAARAYNWVRMRKLLPSRLAQYESGRSLPERGAEQPEPHLEQIILLRRGTGAVRLRFGIMKVTDLPEKGRFSAAY